MAKIKEDWAEALHGGETTGGVLAQAVRRSGWAPIGAFDAEGTPGAQFSEQVSLEGHDRRKAASILSKLPRKGQWFFVARTGANLRAPQFPNEEMLLALVTRELSDQGVRDEGRLPAHWLSSDYIALCCRDEEEAAEQIGTVLTGLESPLPFARSKTDFAGVLQIAAWLDARAKRKNDLMGARWVDVSNNDIYTLRDAIWAKRKLVLGWAERRASHGFVAMAVYREGAGSAKAFEEAVKSASANIRANIGFVEGRSSAGVAVALYGFPAIIGISAYLTKTCESIHSGKVDPVSEILSMKKEATLPPPPMPPEIERLSVALKDVQEKLRAKDPGMSRRLDTREKIEALVDGVNAVLKRNGWCLRLDDGKLARLRVAPGGSGRGFIQFREIGSQESRGFFKSDFDCVPFAYGDAVEKK